MKKDFKEILVSEQEIKEICERLGKEISRDYEGKKLLLVSVLKGGVVFMADLMRNITCDYHLTVKAKPCKEHLHLLA